MSRELLCETCGREYQVWFAPDDLWNRVVRGPGGRDRWQFLCPTCFTNIAADVGACDYFEVRPARARTTGDAP